MTREQEASLEGASLTRNQQWYLLGMTAVGALLRLLYHHGRPFTGDEIGTLIYIKRDIPFLLSHFTTWLTMNYFLVAEKLMAGLLGTNALGLRLIPMSAGIVTIPLIARLALRFTTPRTALVAATLAALNPFLIEFSGVIRAYALLTALTLLLAIVYFRWDDSPTARRGGVVAAVAYLAILAHPNGLYAVAALLLKPAADLLAPSRRARTLRRIPSLLVPLSVSLCLAAIAYLRIYPEMLQEGKTWHDVPPTTLSYLPYLFSRFFSGGYFGWPSALCFLSGVLAAHKHDRPVLVLLPSVFVPMLLMSVQGISPFPWAYPRYLIFILPVAIIFLAEGVDSLAGRFTPSRRLPPAIAVLLVLSWLPRAQEIVAEKTDHPWHLAAAYLKQHARPGDVILESDWLDAFHFSPYFEESGGIDLFQLDASVFKTRGSLKDSATTVYFVSSAHPVSTAQPSRQFGQLQVVRYQPSGGEPAVGMLRKDLIATVRDGEELGPEFAAIYNNIWVLGNALGADSAGRIFYYYNAWIKCLELTPRQKNIPFTLQKAEARNFLNGMR